MQANLGGAVRPRSQLATNRFLIALSQVFGWGAFTSRDVSNRFGLDFLNTAKRLSRMARKPYYLLSARRMPRLYGGYENVYSISTRGWGKIVHLQPTPELKPVEGEGSILLGATRAEVEKDYRYPFLCSRNGTTEECTLLGVPLEVMWLGAPPIRKTHPPKIGSILASLLGPFAPMVGATYWTLRSLRFSEPASTVMCLQAVGLAPTDINPINYANTATYLGATAEEIIISVLARRCNQLNKQLASKAPETPNPSLKPSDWEPTALRLESNLEKVGKSRVESRLRDERMEHANHLNEIFLKLHRIRSRATEQHTKTHIDQILHTIIEMEFSVAKTNS